MIVYFDTSALAKLYLAEDESGSVKHLAEEAQVVGSSVLARVEMSAAIARAVRMQQLARASAARIVQSFRRTWPDYIALQVSEAVLSEADRLAWELGLRGYDAVHLASARIWEQAIGEPVTVATFDRLMRGAVLEVHMQVWPTMLR